MSNLGKHSERHPLQHGCWWHSSEEAFQEGNAVFLGGVRKGEENEEEGGER